MSTPLYQLRVSYVGQYVADYLRENKLILFAAPVPQDIADYCVVHQPGELSGALLPGQTLNINQHIYRITAVGNVATANLKELGHITLNFDGAIEAEFPGMVHLAGQIPETIEPNDLFYFHQQLN
ncbi:PTS glucitol/sorbitol transporter subunit IIA [Pantoea sp. B65]|uniref:PTS glucitol/sorbitol transporter subunit IIA n=1 Tax=Pantoea sp. B65 TaxID=2813359 RepID=UPI0039B5231F